MINLQDDNYITILIEASKIGEGTLVYKPVGDVEYTLVKNEPVESWKIKTDYRRYGRNCDFVYLLHESGYYYIYPANKVLRVVVYKYDLQKYIDDTSEY